jgi:acetyl-CoA acetyltransferase
MVKMSIKGKAAIVGICEVPSGKYLGRSALEQAIEVCTQAILESGIDKSLIDFVLPSSCFADPRFNTDLIFSVMVEELGLQGCKGNMQCNSGGASSSMQLRTAVSLIASGVARAVLCFHTEKLGTGLSGNGVIDFFSTTGISSDWETPYGMHFSPVAGMIMERYKHETGLTDEELAAVCVSNRKWANLHENAMFKDKKLTIEDVMNSKMISTPMRSLESNMLADGGSAFLVVSAEIAEKCETPVWILGEGSAVTHYSLSQEADITKFGYKVAADMAYEESGVTPDKIGLCAIYDSYPIFEIMALEEMGFCKRGEAGKMFLNGDTAPGGRLPVTTNGGMLSQGHTGAGGGHAVLVEAYRQLAGKAGPRQIDNLKYAIETGTGGTYMDTHAVVLGKERS